MNKENFIMKTESKFPRSYSNYRFLDKNYEIDLDTKKNDFKFRLESQSSLQYGQWDCDNFSDETDKFAKSKLSPVIVKKLQNSNLVFPKYLNCADWDKKYMGILHAPKSCTAVCSCEGAQNSTKKTSRFDGMWTNLIKLLNAGRHTVIKYA